MGTCNFGRPWSTDKIYSFFSDNPPADEYDEDWGYNDWVEEVERLFLFDLRYHSVNGHKNRASNDGVLVAECCEVFEMLEYVYVEHQIFIRPGYYNGAALDYKIKFGLNRWGTLEYEDLDGFIEDWYDAASESVNKGLATRFKDTLKDKINQYLTHRHDEIQEAFDKLCTNKLVIQGIFSNGGAVYKEVE